LQPGRAMGRKKVQVRVAGRTVALTPEQAARISEKVADFARAEKSIHDLVNERWIPKYLRRSGLPVSWSWAHELTIPELAALMAYLTGTAEDLVRAAAGENRYTDLLASIDQIEAQEDVPRLKRRKVIVVVALLIALSYSCRAIGFHSLSINELVRRGLDGDAVALRQAVAVDPSVLSMPTVASHLAQLQLQGARRDLAAIFHAAAKGPNKQLQPNWQLRYLERVFREGGTISAYGKDEVFRLVTERLRLYDARGADSFKGLFAAFQRWEQSATT
jgi:hypothetical protein